MHIKYLILVFFLTSYEKLRFFFCHYKLRRYVFRMNDDTVSNIVMLGVSRCYKKGLKYMPFQLCSVISTKLYLSISPMYVVVFPIYIMKISSF